MKDLSYFKNIEFDVFEATDLPELDFNQRMMTMYPSCKSLLSNNIHCIT